jgi:hypothetical protein
MHIWSLFKYSKKKLKIFECQFNIRRIIWPCLKIRKPTIRIFDHIYIIRQIYANSSNRKKLVEYLKFTTLFQRHFFVYSGLDLNSDYEGSFIQEFIQNNNLIKKSYHLKIIEYLKLMKR